jgi:mRNA interferase MazF
MNLVILSMMKIFNHGEVWLANLNPTKGTEPGKTRPVLILQNQTLLDVKHPSTLIIPLSTQLIEDAQPLRFRILAQDKLEKDSDLLIDQLRAIDNRRLLSGPLMRCSTSVMKHIYSLVTEVMGMPEINVSAP